MMLLSRILIKMFAGMLTVRAQDLWKEILKVPIQEGNLKVPIQEWNSKVSIPEENPKDIRIIPTKVGRMILLA